jgi:hypothetical protein
MTFKEILIGGQTKEQLIQRLMKVDIQFNEYAHVLFKHPSFSPHTSEKVALVKVGLADLALSNPCSLQDITDRATHRGLKLCPLYLGAFLRLEYLDQPEGPYLTIASSPPGNCPATGLYLRNHNGALWLRGYQSVDSCEWPADNEFVFMRASKK